MSRLKIEPVRPNAAVITEYQVHGLPEGEARIAMNQSGSGTWGYCWMRPSDKIGHLWGEHTDPQTALRALEKEVFGE